MRTTFIAIITAIVIAGCATAHIFTGAGLQVLACELCKAKPAAKAPLHAAGVAFRAFAGTEPPTQLELATVLAAIPKADALTQVEVEAAWAVVVQAYGLAYSDATTADAKAKLRLWFGVVGNALVAGATCGSTDAPALASRYVSPPPKDAPTIKRLADEIAGSLKAAK